MPCAQPWPRTCGSLKLVLLGGAYADAGDGMTSQAKTLILRLRLRLREGLDKRTSGE